MKLDNKENTKKNVDDDIHYTQERKTILSVRKRVYFSIYSFLCNFHIWVLLSLCIFIIPLSHITNLTFFQLGAHFVVQMITLVVLTCFSYFAHYGSHLFRNFFTIVHHYHHETENKLLGDILQINLEFLASLWMMLLFDPFSVLFFFLLYTSIHNINYGLCHVNNIHERHHKYILTNIGPDICDILFDTKYKYVAEECIDGSNNTNTDNYIWTIFKQIIKTVNNNMSSELDEVTIQIENIYHILPNILGSMFLILVLKQLNNTSYIRRKLKLIFITLSILSIITHFIASVCIFANDDHPDKSLLF